MTQIQVFPDPAALQQAAAQQIVTLAAQAIGERGRFSIALSGGSTSKGLYERLARPPFRSQIAWERVHLFWGDERYVPHDHPESSYRMVYETLLTQVPLSLANIHPCPTDEQNPQRAAERYAQELRAFFGASDRFDLVLLGMGPDGHTASLFPQHPALQAGPETLVAVVENAPKPPPLRLSLTPAAINAARMVLFLVTGSDKAATLRAVLQGPATPQRLPCQLIRPVNGELRWLADAAAAAAL